MNTDKKIIIIALSTLAMGLFLGWLIFGGSSSKNEVDESHHQHTTEIAGEGVWTCSMHPQIRQGDPGNCPICGMDLIPLEDDQNEAFDPMAVSMSPTAMQLADIRTAAVGAMDAVKTVRLHGKVQADERLISSQSSHISGRIQKLMVSFTGEYVEKGQVIAYIYSPDLVTAQAELFEAEKIKETQPQLFNSAREKLKNWKLSNAQIDKILEAGSPSEEFPIMADQSGYVLSKNVNPGDYITRGEPIYEIVNLSVVWVLFDVYESDIPWINKGDKVNFTVASIPGETFDGIITFVDPMIDPKTRVANARVEIANSGLTLKPEMFVSGTVEAKLLKKGNNVVVPKTAVMWTGQRSVVYVKNTNENGVNFMLRNVVLGPSLGDSFVVEKGLGIGEEIAINGTFSIDAAAQLAGKPSMMNPEGGPAMTGHNHGGGEMAATASPVSNNAVKEIAISEQAKQALQPLFKNYLSLKNALVEDDLEVAQKAVSRFKIALEKVNNTVFNESSQNVWMSHSSDMKNAVNAIQHLKTIQEVRTTFQQVSESMIALTKVFTPFEQTLYVQFCPMKDTNKGANWLSTEEEIRNPYFGASMLTCGEVITTIK